MIQPIFIIIGAILAFVSGDESEVIAACKDVDGLSHRLGEAYIGPDACNQCKCIESGSACTKRLCPSDASSRSAEANKCVDNKGVLHAVNETYTHVDGCNTCKCSSFGGACTRKFCVKKENRVVSSCLDSDGNEKALNEEWLDKDGCNNCVCGILGSICTEKLCGVHRTYENEKDQVKVHEFIHNEHGTIVDESGDQYCKDDKGNTQWPGNTWLTEDSCNVCHCIGNGSAPLCSKMGCRVRLERLLQSNLTGGSFRTSSPLLLLMFWSVVMAALHL